MRNLRPVALALSVVLACVSSGVAQDSPGRDTDSSQHREERSLGEGQAAARQIAQKVMQQLRWLKQQGKLTGFGVDVEVVAGVVKLDGYVVSQAQLQRLLSKVRSIEGVESVESTIKIQPPAAAQTFGVSRGGQRWRYRGSFQFPVFRRPAERTLRWSGA